MRCCRPDLWPCPLLAPLLSPTQTLNPPATTLAPLPAQHGRLPFVFPSCFLCEPIFSSLFLCPTLALFSGCSPVGSFLGKRSRQMTPLCLHPSPPFAASTVYVSTLQALCPQPCSATCPHFFRPAVSMCKTLLTSAPSTAVLAHFPRLCVQRRVLNKSMVHHSVSLNRPSKQLLAGHTVPLRKTSLQLLFRARINSRHCAPRKDAPAAS